MEKMNKMTFIFITKYDVMNKFEKPQTMIKNKISNTYVTWTKDHDDTCYEI